MQVFLTIFGHDCKQTESNTAIYVHWFDNKRRQWKWILQNVIVQSMQIYYIKLCWSKVKLLRLIFENLAPLMKNTVLIDLEKQSGINNNYFIVCWNGNLRQKWIQAYWERGSTVKKKQEKKKQNKKHANSTHTECRNSQWALHKWHPAEQACGQDGWILLCVPCDPVDWDVLFIPTCHKRISLCVIRKLSDTDEQKSCGNIRFH